jgi:hypothetical protein
VPPAGIYRITRDAVVLRAEVARREARQPIQAA